MVVLANVPLAEAVEIDRICHSKGVAVVSACIRGVFAYVFCDFGPRFIVNDTDGGSAALSVFNLKSRPL